MTWRVRLAGPAPELNVRLRNRAGPGAKKGSRKVWFAETGRYMPTVVYDRYRLAPGDTFRGPAVVEERESTMVIGGGASARVDGIGNLVVDFL